MYKLGLKLWSVNTDYYYDEAIRLYNEKAFDYIELYVVPDTLNKLEKWEKLNIPFILHAPHFAHNVNLANANCIEYNNKIYCEVEEYRKALNAKYTVVHGGMEGNVQETIRQINIIRPKNMLIENKPYKAPLGKRNLCRGYNIEEIHKIISETNCGFCLDIGHAICSANSLRVEPYTFIQQFIQMKPSLYHLSDGYIDSDYDNHLHLSCGTYDLNKILNMINDNSYISIETDKNSKTDLKDYESDIKFIKNFCHN